MSAHTVKEVQDALIEQGYDIGPEGDDGEAGRDTDKAITLYQEDHPPLRVNGNIRDTDFLRELFSNQPKDVNPMFNNILGGLLQGLFGNLLNWQLVQGYIRNGLLWAAGAIGLDGLVGHDGTLTIVGAALTIIGVLFTAISNNEKKKALDVVKAVDEHPKLNVVPAHRSLSGKPEIKLAA